MPVRLTRRQKRGKFTGQPLQVGHSVLADIRFGPFTLDAAATRLERDGREIRLRPQGLLALRVLLRHAGNTVGYQQMIDEAWDGTIVSRHTVDVTIGEVRKSLGEFGSWIVNRPKLGHRIDVPK